MPDAVPERGHQPLEARCAGDRQRCLDLLRRDRLPLARAPLGHGEIEGVVRVQAHAQVGQHQPPIAHLGAHEAVIEPVQPPHRGNGGRPRLGQRLGVGGVAVKDHRPLVEQRAFGIDIAAGCHRHHAPQQHGKRQRRGKARCVRQTQCSQVTLGLALHLELGKPGHAKHRRGQRQSGNGAAPPSRVFGDAPGDHAAQQQPQGEGRFDDEKQRPHHWRQVQRPQQRSAVDGAGVDQRMAEQAGLDQPEPAHRRGLHPAAAGPAHPPHQPADQRQHKHRVQEAAVPGHQAHRVVGEHRQQQHVQIRHGVERRAGQQGGAALTGRCDRRANGTAEKQVGDRVHGRRC